MRRRFWVGVLIIGLGLAGCVPAPAPSPSPIPTVDPWSWHGPITLAAPSSLAEELTLELVSWNQQHLDQQVTLHELPDDADLIREELLKHASDGSGEYTVTLLDLALLPELETEEAFQELLGNIAEIPEVSELVPALRLPSYSWSKYAVAYGVDADLLYYRKDLVGEYGELNWETLIKNCLPSVVSSCFATAFGPNSAFTDSVLEFAALSGGQPLGISGRLVDMSSIQLAVSKLSDGFKAGTIPTEAWYWDDEDVAAQLKAGRLTWAVLPASYYDELVTPSVDESDPARLSAITWPGGGELTAYGLAISSHGQNLGTASEVVAWLASTERQISRYRNSSLPPALDAAFLDVVDPEITAAVSAGHLRPVVADGYQIQSAITETLRPAVAGNVKPSQAVSELSARLAEIIARR